MLIKHLLIGIHWNKNKSYSQEIKNKISLAKKGKCLSEKHKKNISKNSGKYWKNKKRLDMTGELNAQWKGGIGRTKQSTSANPEYKKWRRKIFQRDNWTCQTCGIKGVEIQAHHIKSWAKYPELRYEIENGVTLCIECHKLTDNYKGKNKNA